jgi:hypothetical protein
MSRGYTIAFASTAPVAPAIALPHGGKGLASIAVFVLDVEDEGGRRVAEERSSTRAGRRLRRNSDWWIAT